MKFEKIAEALEQALYEAKKSKEVVEKIAVTEIEAQKDVENYQEAINEFRKLIKDNLGYLDGNFLPELQARLHYDSVKGNEYPNAQVISFVEALNVDYNTKTEIAVASEPRRRVWQFVNNIRAAFFKALEVLFLPEKVSLMELAAGRVKSKSLPPQKRLSERPLQRKSSIPPVAVQVVGGLAETVSSPASNTLAALKAEEKLEEVVETQKTVAPKTPKVTKTITSREEATGVFPKAERVASAALPLAMGGLVGTAPAISEERQRSIALEAELKARGVLK